MAARVEAMEDRQLLAVANSMIGLNPGAVISQRKAANTRLDPALVDLSNMMARSRSAGVALNSMPLSMLSDPFGRVAVTVTASDVNNVLPKLRAFGFSSTFADAKLHTIEGYLPITSLSAAAGLGSDGLLGIIPIYRPETAAGSVTSQADYIHQADRVRNTPIAGVNGAGQRVGIVSDSFNVHGGYAADIASGDLPNNVRVVSEGPAGSTDEGRAMAQLVHDLAPGAGLAFASGSSGQGSLANAIRDLANPGLGNATIITDDIYYSEEPQFQDGLVAQAINEVVAGRDIAYFSLAGNLGSNSYESTNVDFVEEPGYGDLVFYDFDFGPGTDIRQRITVAPGQVIGLNLQWDDPFYTTGGVDTDLDIFLLGEGDEVLAAGDRDNLLTQIPSELLVYTNNTGAPQTLDIAMIKYAGPNPGRLKWTNFGANRYGPVTVDEYATNSPALAAHSAASGALSVAAAPAYNPLVPESYSSLGPFTALFAADGTRLATPDVRQAPDITSIDYINTAHFGNFIGTSAAAPHAAAVAALLRQAEPAFTAAQVYARLIATATDIVDPSQGAGVGIDNKTGAGLINAYRAIFGPAVATTLPYRDGFESSALSNRWEIDNTGAARTVVTAANGPASGGYHLTMDAGVEGFVGLNQATLLVNATAASGNVLLAFHQKEFGDEDDAMPATFTGRGSYDGVALSVDGTNWYRLVSLTGTDSTDEYRSFLFDLTAFVAANGLTLGANTRIRFQHYGKSGIPADGFAFDDVRVAVAAPVTAVAVDDGGGQRSSVRQVTLDLAGLVASAPSNAFTITRAQDGATFAATVALVAAGPNGTRIRLTFGGPGTESGSLPDGDYTLSVNGALILDDLGAAADVDANGTPGGTRSIGFFRLFGDVDGDRDVDGTDFAAFRQAYLGLVPLPSFLDYDNDGVIVNDLVDRDAFLARRGKRLTSVGVVFA